MEYFFCIEYNLEWGECKWVLEEGMMEYIGRVYVILLGCFWLIVRVLWFFVLSRVL